MKVLLPRCYEITVRYRQ